MADWTEQEDALLRKLRKDGLSASEIGKQLGRGRNSILGRCHRLGLSESSDPHRRPRPLPKPRTIQFRPKTFQPTNGNGKTHAVKSAVRAAAKAAHKVKPHVEPEVPRPETACGLLELTNESCRFPLGDPKSPNFCFCGGSASFPKVPYCDYHMRVAFNNS